ncbi:MAG TPA: glycoside hydrolase family 99-like domain-containing protein [Acidimicrobiia bacterium]|nr:glycoside hydrolase family 99-like domain-containing protein [Acidimicrobiia bacterium]
MSQDARVDVIAFYLPQFHPIPENDEWWGPGFTEWTNVASARRMFPGHYQPRVPGELGFYDLRLPETREAQAALAAQYGVTAFCYWHYWFGAGRRLLERPFDEVVQSGRPEFPFCLGWANQTWSGIWHGAPERTLIEQTYPGEDDHRAHFEALLPAFTDRRYFRVDGRPLFYVYDPTALPEAQRFLDLWRTWAVDAGLPGIYFIAQAWEGRRSSTADFDAFANEKVPSRTVRRRDLLRRLGRKLGVAPVHSARAFVETMPLGTVDAPSAPIVVPGWDNTPRSGAQGVVLHPPNPAVFEEQVASAVAHVVAPNHNGPRLVLVKAWNEWAEGCYLEPDRRFGRAYLEALQQGLACGLETSAR